MKKYKPFLPILILAVIYLLAFWADRQYTALKNANPPSGTATDATFAPADVIAPDQTYFGQDETLAPMGTTQPDQAYFERENAFILGVMDSETGEYLGAQDPLQMNVKFIGREPTEESSISASSSRENLDFLNLTTGKAFSLILDTFVSDHISLIPEKIYTIAYQKIMGWPGADGLLILDDQSLVFLGVRDVGMGEHITVQALSPIQVEQTRLLEDHVKYGEECWSKKTDREIQFAQGDNVIRLHQGQMASLGPYSVHLLVAEDIVYTNNCLDAGEDQISYIIYP